MPYSQPVAFQVFTLENTGVSKTLLTTVPHIRHSLDSALLDKKTIANFLWKSAVLHVKSPMYRRSALKSRCHLFFILLQLDSFNAIRRC